MKSCPLCSLDDCTCKADIFEMMQTIYTKLERTIREMEQMRQENTLIPEDIYNLRPEEICNEESWPKDFVVPPWEDAGSPRSIEWRQLHSNQVFNTLIQETQDETGK